MGGDQGDMTTKGMWEPGLGPGTKKGHQRKLGEGYTGTLYIIFTTLL